MMVQCLILLVLLFMKIECNIKEITIVNSDEKSEFDWLRNKNFLPLYVKPEKETALLVPTNISALAEREFIACFVISAPKNINARNAIRTTWGKLIRPIFLIGQTDNETMISVHDEAELFNDIIIEDFVDVYVNLTIKTAFAMKSFLTYFNNSKYFFKIDDDVFLNVKSLYEILNTVPRDALIGSVELKSEPIRNKKNKWYIPRFLFEEGCFPAYLHGPSYMIPGRVENILKH